jgi:hypothetical protein
MKHETLQTEFNPQDVRTWPVTLTVEQVATIYQRSAKAIQASFTPKSRAVPFRPAPFKRRPLRWRRADVERDVFGQRKVAS